MKTIAQKIKKNIPLAPLTTFNIGGKAKLFFQAKNPNELIEAIKWAEKQKIQFKIFGGGSNILFPDEGLNCLVIQAYCGKIKVSKNKIAADAGVLLLQIIKKATALGLAGLESLSGIPGTIGGAIVGNAGAFSHSMSDAIEKVEIWDGEKRRWLKKEQCNFQYRSSIFKDKPYIVLKAVLKFKKDRPASLKNKMQKILQTRAKKYPRNILCAGSVFKNVLVKNVSKKSLALIDKTKITNGKIPVGYLLEQIDAKGIKIGSIKVADFHSNFFINIGKGTAKDVKKLAEILKDKIKKKFGIMLEEEIRFF